MVQSCVLVLVFRQWEAGVLYLGCGDSACHRHRADWPLIYCRAWSSTSHRCMCSTGLCALLGDAGWDGAVCPPPKKAIIFDQVGANIRAGRLVPELCN